MLYNDDCLKVLPTLADNSIDLVITSPPYEDISGAGYSAQNKYIFILC